MASAPDDLNSLFIKFIEAHKALIGLNNSVRRRAGRAGPRCPAPT